MRDTFKIRKVKVQRELNDNNCHEPTDRQSINKTDKNKTNRQSMGGDKDLINI